MHNWLQNYEYRIEISWWICAYLCPMNRKFQMFDQDNTAIAKKSLSDVLKLHLRRFIHLPDEDFDAIANFFQPLTIKKKKNLLEKGETCKRNYFVASGCLRMFFIDDNGVEQTTQFAIENWWITDLMAFQKQVPSDFFIQAVENSEVFAIKYNAQDELLMQYPAMERYFRIIYQHALAALQMRAKYHHYYSKEELYHHFSKGFPEFIQRVPQYLLASYLGFTPEYLSEIRKKMIS
jgi:CRP-like cAMP-binding protein